MLTALSFFAAIALIPIIVKAVGNIMEYAQKPNQEFARTPASPDPVDELQEIPLNSPVRFGLVQQGHIPTIERMRGEGRMWKEIAKEIGWDTDTLIQHYGWYVEKMNAASPDVQTDYDPEMDMALSLPKADLIPVLNEAKQKRKAAKADQTAGYVESIRKQGTKSRLAESVGDAVKGKHGLLP